MDDNARETAFMSALVTEHFALQSMAAATINEANGRASLYLLSLSTSVVALAFALQSSADVFAPFAAAILPTLFLLGCFTVVRLVDVSIQNVVCLRSIVRIRRFYGALTPYAAEYFPTTGDIMTDTQDMLGYRKSRMSLWFTLAAMIGTVNAVLGGTMVTLLVAGVAHASRALAFALGAAVAVVLATGAVALEQRRFASAFSD